jgi:hypothetical protein
MAGLGPATHDFAAGNRQRCELPHSSPATKHEVAARLIEALVSQQSLSVRLRPLRQFKQPRIGHDRPPISAARRYMDKRLTQNDYAMKPHVFSVV